MNMNYYGGIKYKDILFLIYIFVKKVFYHKNNKQLKISSKYSLFTFSKMFIEK